MKIIRYILFAWATVIAVSCSKHNADGPGPIGPDPLNSYIFFEPGVLDVVETKATLITEFPQTEGTAFGVLGFYEDDAPIFNGYKDNIAKVYKASGVYKYDYLAPWLGSQHTFHAFYPYDELKGLVGTDNNGPYIGYTQPTTTGDMKDILGAYLQTDKTTLVQMHFQHLMWAFNIVFKNSQSMETTASSTITDPYIKITEVTLKLQGFPTSANLYLDEDHTVTPGTATSDKNYTIYSASAGTQIDKGKSHTFGPMLLIPVTGLKYQVTIKYTTQGGVSDTYVYPAAGQYKTLSKIFQRGQAYDLTIEKKNDKFFVGIEPGEWTSQDVVHSFE